jgi:hypothetical protein
VAYGTVRDHAAVVPLSKPSTKIALEQCQVARLL